MSVTVSAIIPLFNGAPFIREALESVFAQTRPVDQVIVVDDGSTDDGAAVARQAAGDRPVLFLQQANAGQGAARNLGARHATGSHIAFLDQDDAWYPDHLEILAAPLAASEPRQPALVYGDLDQVDEAGRMFLRNALTVIPTPHPKQSLQDCLKAEMYILPSASLIERAAFESLNGFDERFIGYEDDDLFTRLFAAGHRVTFLPTAVTRWRIHGRSASFSANMIRSRMLYCRKLIETFPDDPRLGWFWKRDCIVPRFFKLTAEDFIAACRRSDRAAVDLTWSAIRTLAPDLAGGRGRRLRLFAPLIDWAVRHGRHTLARRLLRRASR